MEIQTIARQLLEARTSGMAVDWRLLPIDDAAAAYAVQDACIAHLGAVGGWKVGSKGDGSTPAASPLPVSGVLPSGAVLAGTGWRLRGLEVEMALRVGRDLAIDEMADTREALVTVFDAVLPAIEVVETRLAPVPCENPWAGMADLQSHGALIIGQPLPLTTAPDLPDLRTLVARLAVDGLEVARLTGGNPAGAGDIWAVLAWLVRHAAARGLPLRRGQIVTTGSCTGVQYALAGQEVRGEVEGLGAVELMFAA